MQELLEILNDNGIKYSVSDYAGYESVVIKKNKYQLEIFKDDKGYVSDLQRVPYTWGRMGSTTIDGILEDLRNFLGINITSSQLSIF
jgi:hypothetical protein